MSEALQKQVDELQAKMEQLWSEREKFFQDSVRLLAERDELLGKVEEWNRRCQYNADTAHDLQFELTKTRELIQQNCRPIIVAECERTDYGNANARSVLEIIDSFIAGGHKS